MQDQPNSVKSGVFVLNSKAYIDYFMPIFEQLRFSHLVNGASGI